MGEAVKWFEDTVRAKLPPGASLALDGETGEFLKSGGQLYFTFVFAIAIVFLVLAAQFESFVHPAIIMVTVPLALVGAVFGLKLYGLSINIFSQIAVVMLVGIAAKNGVLIVEFANQLRDRGVEFTDAVVRSGRHAPAPDADDQPLHGVRRAAVPVRRRRRAPSSASLSASWCSMARLVSVLLTLFVVPAVYSLVARKTKSPHYMSDLVDKLMGPGAAKPRRAGATGAG